MNGSAYACVDMDEMMTVYYERTRRLLQNTGWWKEYEQGLYYNMGATYLAVGRYEEALDCLNRVRSEDFLLCHKRHGYIFSLEIPGGGSLSCNNETVTFPERYEG